jgi:hypothetical protein
LEADADFTDAPEVLELLASDWLELEEDASAKVADVEAGIAEDDVPELEESVVNTVIEFAAVDATAPEEVDTSAVDVDELTVVPAVVVVPEKLIESATDEELAAEEMLSEEAEGALLAGVLLIELRIAAIVTEGVMLAVNPVGCVSE